MKSIIYTYKDFKPVFKEANRYYHVKNERDLDRLIEKFIDFDAVTTPATLSFPVVLELVSGFTPRFKRADKKKMANQLRRLKTFVEAT